METLHLSTACGRVRVYRQGTGPKALLLLHGSGCDSALLSWREVMETLGEDYSVYAPDLPGYGGSDDCSRLVGGQFYEKHIALLRELTEQLSLTRFGLAGLSMGGAIAMGYALQYPGQVAYLLPVASWGLSERLPCHRLSWWYIQHTDWTLRQYRLCARSKGLTRWFLRAALLGDEKKRTDALVKEVMAACRGDRAGRAMLDFQRSSAGRERAVPYYGGRLKELRMPVAFLAGEKDPLVPLRHVRAAHEAVRGSRLYVEAGCKHWLVRERPERFCAAVEELSRAAAKKHPRSADKRKRGNR